MKKVPLAVLLLAINAAAFAQSKTEFANNIEKIPRYLGVSLADLGSTIKVSVDYRRDSVLWARAADYPFATASTMFYLQDDRLHKIESSLALNTDSNMHIIVNVFTEVYGEPDTVIGERYFWSYSRGDGTIIIEIVRERYLFSSAIVGKWYFNNY